MKTLVKLAIAALLAYAVFRVANEYVDYIKFREDVRDTAIFKGKTEDDLRRRVLDLATRYDMPLSADDLEVHVENRHVVVNGHYVKPIELAPNYKYPWPFSFEVDVEMSTTIPMIPPKPEVAASPRR